jgi:hypothetical protein
MLWVGGKGRTIFLTWQLNADESKVLKNYYDKFEEYVKQRSNVIFNRYKFHSKVQEQKETFEQFATQLKNLVRDFSYDKPDEMVRDRIVIGVRNPKIREKLIQVGSELQLQNAMEIARTHELSQAQAKSMAGEDNSLNYV